MPLKFLNPLIWAMPLKYRCILWFNLCPNVQLDSVSATSMDKHYLWAYIMSFPRCTVINKKENTGQIIVEMPSSLCLTWHNELQILKNQQKQAAYYVNSKKARQFNIVDWIILHIKTKIDLTRIFFCVDNRAPGKWHYIHSEVVFINRNTDHRLEVVSHSFYSF
jgi:hypothetical protein